MPIFRIIYGSDFNLQKLDINLFKIKLLSVKSIKYKQFFNNFQPPVHKMFLEVRDLNKNDHSDKRFALISEKEGKDYSFDFLNALIVACPSSIQLTHEIPFLKTDNKYQWMGTMTTFPIRFTYWNTSFNNFSIDCNTRIVNNFLKQYMNVINNNDIQFTISTYINSFYCNRPDLCFLNLCMALESILEDGNELIFRLKRMIAVLCGNTVESCRIISENVNVIYKLRSTIIHGGNYSSDKVLEYLPYLKILTSRVIIEIVKHGLTKKELNNQIIEIGYGYKHKISKNILHLNLNFAHYNIIQSQKLKK